MADTKPRKKQTDVLEEDYKGYDATVAGRLLSYWRPYTWWVIAAAAIMSMTALINLSRPWIVSQIIDTGIGLTAEQRSHIFEEFYKGDESRHDRSSVGLGLSICKGIVIKHGGRIRALSEGVGRGTTLNFNLPEAKAGKPIQELNTVSETCMNALGSTTEQ